MMGILRTPAATLRWSLLLLLDLLVSHRVFGWSQRSIELDRRIWFSQILVATNAAIVAPTVVAAAEGELPMALRPYTKLAPLNRNTQTAASFKSLHLSLDEIAARLTRDLTVGATGQGSYIVTGNLSTDIFWDTCSFVDPTNKVDNLQQYQTALTILFDPATSHVDLLEPLTVNQVDNTITGRYRCRGTLKLPWHPVVTAFESDIVYTVDPDSGLIAEQRQSWSKSAATALRESFTPGIFTSPPVCTRPNLSNEPTVVSKLFDSVNSRRNADYSDAERHEIEALIDEIAAQKFPWQPDSLPGKWRLVYLRPGSDGAGIDRRVPFPEFPFNDSFQVFGSATSEQFFGSISNIGELFGPSVLVTVSGDLIDVHPDSTAVPKRLQANIQGGKLCASNNCIDLPISGMGLLDSVYLGARLRIGQNVNGGGALVVQVRVD
jgi:hypothetical protein